MRIPTRLSYSGFAKFESNLIEFFYSYLSTTRPDRMPQERPAAVGSAWDAYVKSGLYEALFGKNDPKYEFEALFTAQVEPHNRDWALEEGKHVFDCYKVSGLYDELLGLLQKSIEPPRFEFQVDADVLGVPFTGKPDCRFVLPGPVAVIHDFKCNGYCSNSTTSPCKGFRRCFDGFVAIKQNKTHNTAHKQYAAQLFHDFEIDTNFLEDCNKDWADQLSLYAWALGEEVGSPYVLSIDQCVAKPLIGQKPQLRFSNYRARVRQSYQEHLAKRFTTVWDVIKSGYIFRELTPEESEAKCKILEKATVQLQSDGTAAGDFMVEAVRSKYRG